MKKKIIFIIVGIVVILGLIGGGIYFFYFKNVSADVQAQQQFQSYILGTVTELGKKVVANQNTESPSSIDSTIQNLVNRVLEGAKNLYKDGKCKPKFLFGVAIYSGDTDKYIYFHIRLWVHQYSEGPYMQDGKCRIGFFEVFDRDYVYRYNKRTQRSIFVGTDPTLYNVNWQRIHYYNELKPLYLEIDKSCCPSTPTPTSLTPSPSISATPTQTPTPSTTTSRTPTPTI